MLLSESQFGKYEILKELGHGTWPVYLAKDTLLGKTVALKVISCAEEDRALIREEARILDRLQTLNHPNIVHFYGADFFTIPPDNLKIVIAMEWVDGCDLRQYLRDNGPLPVSEALAIAKSILNALEAAHSLHVLHRDIKPANVLMGNDRSVKLADFGQARSVSTHSVADSRDGTYAYMAPEFFSSEVRTDRRADLWAVGITLYEMVTGERPFHVERGDTNDPFVWADVVKSAVIPSLPTQITDKAPGLQAILNKALSKNLGGRYPSADAFAKDIEQLQDKLDEPATVTETVKAAPMAAPAPQVPRLNTTEVWNKVRPIYKHANIAAGIMTASLIAFLRKAHRQGSEHLRHLHLQERLAPIQTHVRHRLRNTTRKQWLRIAVMMSGVLLLFLTVRAVSIQIGNRASKASKVAVKSHLPQATLATTSHQNTSRGIANTTPSRQITPTIPVSANAAAIQGKAALKQHHTQQGASLLQRAVALGDNTADTHLALGIAYCRLGDDDLKQGQRASALSHYRGAYQETNALTYLGYQHPGQRVYKTNAAYLIHQLKVRAYSLRHGARHSRHKGHGKHHH